MKTQLYKQPWRFSFFQAVRLIQNVFSRQSPQNSQAIGFDSNPKHECVKFSALTSTSHARSDVVSIVPAEKDEAPVMKVSFMGVGGVQGALPIHYTEIIAQRQREKDTAMRDFYDLLNHRSISLFYRAWQKNRLPMAFEAVKASGNWRQPDDITNALLAVTGLRAHGDCDEDELYRREKTLYFGGLFSSPQRTAHTLEQLLNSSFDVPCAIEQFVGEWGIVGEDDYVVLSSSPALRQNNRLGVNTLIGTKAYCLESRFRVIIGPLNKARFDGIRPGSDKLHELCEFVRSYVGPSLRFDITLRLQDSVKTPCILGKNGEAKRLGWDAWLTQSQSEKSSHLIDINIPSYGL